MKTLKNRVKNTKNDFKKVLKCHYLEFNYFNLIQYITSYHSKTINS